MKELKILKEALNIAIQKGAYNIDEVKVVLTNFDALYVNVVKLQDQVDSFFGTKEKTSLIKGETKESKTRKVTSK